MVHAMKQKLTKNERGKLNLIINDLMSLDEKQERELIKNLESIKGVELKYNQLCGQLNLKIKSSNTKTRQLEDLQTFCQLDKLSSPTRYMVTEVYDKAVLGLKALHQNNKYQLLFEAAIYQSFIKNNNEPLWLSNMEMLKLFQEVNENFAYACNPQLMKKMGPEYIYMTNMSQTVYRILRQWTKRRIEFMAKREVVLLTTGYRIYTEHYGNHGRYLVYRNVVKGSEEEKICTGLRNKAIEEIMPDKWEGEWVPDWMWHKFEKRVSELTRETFGGNYCDIRLVYIISPPNAEWLQYKLMKTYEGIEALSGINQEACRKILTTTQLDSHTGEDRKNFIEVNMSNNPKILFKEILRTIK